MGKDKLKIGITCGDLNGIGLEVVLKTLADERILDLFHPVLYASEQAVLAYTKKALDLKEIVFNNLESLPNFPNFEKPILINCFNQDETVDIKFGEPSATMGQYAFKSLERASADLLAQKINALVTAPIHKNSMKSADFKFAGHTEYLQSKDGKDNSLMFMLSENLKIGVVTTHVPLRTVAFNLSKEAICRKICLMYHVLKVEFKEPSPRIAVLGLNPHAGDGGFLGLEEQEMILPAIEDAKKELGKPSSQSIIVEGCFAADGFFAHNAMKRYHAVLAMYHDQGLIPFKMQAALNGVNYTAGLNFVRTSPVHGTAYDIAGKNKADAGSFRQAVYTAIDLVRKRNEAASDRKDPLPLSKPSVLRHHPAAFR